MAGDNVPDPYVKIYVQPCQISLRAPASSLAFLHGLWEFARTRGTSFGSIERGLLYFGVYIGVPLLMETTMCRLAYARTSRMLQDAMYYLGPEDLAQPPH